LELWSFASKTIDWVSVPRSVSKVVKIALLVSDNSTATMAIFTAVNHWSFSEWRHSLAPCIYRGFKGADHQKRNFSLLLNPTLVHHAGGVNFELCAFDVRKTSSRLLPRSAGGSFPVEGFISFRTVP
jgi:hypothetical protein